MADIDVYKDWLGIPEGSRPPDHYELLRLVRFEDDTQKIRGFYKKLNNHVRKYATGQYSDESQELLNELAKAMLCLTDPQRKREYDESLGREFEQEVDVFGRIPLEDVLEKQGHITREQKAELLDFAEQRGLSTRDAAVQMKLAAPDVAAQALAQQLGYSYVELEDMLPEDDILDRTPRNMVRKHTFLPLFVDDDRLLVATLDDIDHRVEDELRLRYGVAPRPVIVTPRSLKQAIAKYYAPGARDEAAAQAAVSGKSTKQAKKGKSTEKGGKSTAKQDDRAFVELSDEEKRQRKQMGLLIMCWSFIVPVLIDQFVIYPQFFPAVSGSMRYIPILAWFVAPPSIWWVLNRYWK